MNKEKFIMEFVFNSCSHSVLWKAISTPDGLSCWFADEVRNEENGWVFVWNGAEQTAQRISHRDMDLVKFRWDDEPHQTFFELKINEDDLTGNVTLTITDFADKDDLEDAQLLWRKQIKMLTRRLGAC